VALLAILVPLDALAAPHRIIASTKPGGPIGVVDERSIRISNDDGATFRTARTAAGDDIFQDAAIGSDGTIFVLRATAAGAALDVVGPSVVTTHPMPAVRELAVVDRTVAVLRADGVVLSTDGGASFVTVPIPKPCPDCDASGLWTSALTVFGGSALVTDVEIDTCSSADVVLWQRLVQLRSSSVSQRNLLVPPADFAARWSFGAFGWIYGHTRADRILALGSTGAAPVTGLPVRFSPNDLLVAHNGRTTVASWGTLVFELDGAAAHVLDANAPSAELLAIDGAGRPIISSGDEVWRFSRAQGPRASGWSRLTL
jgi:hypothetical protein